MSFRNTTEKAVLTLCKTSLQVTWLGSLPGFDLLRRALVHSLPQFPFFIPLGFIPGHRFVSLQKLPILTSCLLGHVGFQGIMHGLGQESSSPQGWGPRC